jgi:subtilase family serine protease
MAMKPRIRLTKPVTILALPLALSLCLAGNAPAQTQHSLFNRAESVTDEDPNKVVEATVWLNLHNKQQLDEAVSNLYQEGSPTYHQWLKTSDLARYAPSATDLETVRRELSGQGLTVTSVGGHNLYLKVSGNVATMQSAFHTQIKSLSIKGKAVRATTSEPKLNGAAASLVSGVSGLSERKLKPQNIRAVDPDSGTALPAVPVTSSPNGIFYSANCFRGLQAHVFTTPGAALPVASYAGNRYGADIANTANGTLPPCGYDFVNVANAYGLGPAFAAGLDGTGQTIVIVDAYGSPTIAADANTFSQLNGLPALTSSNFQVIYPGGPAQATDPANLSGWQAETSIDVEWAHSLAPGANIILLVSPSDFDTDLATTLIYGIVNQFGSVISNSYNGDEFDDLAQYPQELVISNAVTELGVALGMSINYSSGDDGDLGAVVGSITVGDLSASPYATSVGGTTLAIDKNNAIKFQTGWGNNITKLAGPTGAPLDPPLNEGNIGGSGGGESVYFPKPAWQSSLPGKGRQQPDIALEADPYTGVEIIVTIGNAQYVEVYGGTSVACPLFSAIWAIANQKAGQIHGNGTLLGQAAPIIAKLAGTKAITDILPYSSPTNVAGFIVDSNGDTFYSPDQLAAPLEGTTEYLGALYNSPFSGSWFDLTFGTDTSLVVTPGWDNVTGFGSPNGLDFINAAAK